jgi:hypothetical protein
MTATLVLFEFVDDAEEASRIAAEESATIVPLSPEVVDWLSAKGDRRSSQNWPDSQPADDVLAMGNLDRLNELVRVFDEAGAAAFGSAIPGYRVGACHAWPLMTLLDSLAFRAHRLNEVLALTRATRVIYFRPRHEPGSRLVFEPYESIWSSIVRLCTAKLSAERGIAFDGRHSHATPCRVARRIAATRPGTSLRQRAARSEVLTRIVRSYRQNISKFATVVDLGACLIPTNLPRVLIVGNDLELSPLGAQLHTENVEVWHWSDPATLLRGGKRWRVPVPRRKQDQAAANAFLDVVLGDAAFRNAWSWCGIDCAPVAQERTVAFARRTISATASSFEYAHKLLDRLRPTAVIHGEIGSDSWKRAVLEAAGSIGIERWFMQWGGNYGYAMQPYIGHAECRSDIFAAYTNGVAAAIHGTAQLSDSMKSISVGSLHFAKLQGALERRPNQPPGRVVYVMSALAGNARYGPFLCVDDVKYFEIARAVISVLGKAFGNRVVVKRHPSNVLAPDPVGGWIRRTGLPVDVSAERLDTTLLVPSVWVLDNQATSVQEIAITNDPIIYLYTGGSRLSAEGERLLRKRVTWIDCGNASWQEQLKEAATAALDPTTSSEVNEEFVRCFVKDRSNEKSEDVVRRIASALRKESATQCDLRVDGQVGGAHRRMVSPFSA